MPAHIALARKSFFCLFVSLFLIALNPPVHGQGLYLANVDTSITNGQADVSRREAVQEAFLFNYRNYVQYAFGFDFVNAADKVGENDGTTAGLGGTIADALSTMIVMGLQNSDEYKNATMFIQNQNYTNSTQANEDGQPGSVSLFELTIRYLGGFLSAFQLNGERDDERFLVDKAKSMADALKGAWIGSNRIPVAQWNINTQTPVNLSKKVNIAQAGTLTMEWQMVSHYTNDQTYGKLAEESVDAVRNASAFYPGLPFTTIDPSTETTDSTYITIGGGFDSYLEYLLKYPLLLGQSDHRFLSTYKDALSSIQTYLTIKSSTLNFTFLSDYDKSRSSNVYVFSHLACFIGGNVAMAGKLLGRDDWVQLGLEFTESCAGTYSNTALHLGPYGFGYADQKDQYAGWNYVSRIQKKFVRENGFFVSVGYWFVAPEVLESIFYAYRITGQQFWRDLAWQIFGTIKLVSDTGIGYAPVVNVNDESSAILGEQPTFLYSETLLYLYLIFDDSSSYSLDDYVFTTEGHPFRRPNTNGFGKVQGTFAYTPITGPLTGASAQSTSASTADDQDQGTAQNVVLAQPGAGAQEYATSLHSLTGIPEQIAYFNLKRCLKH